MNERCNDCRFWLGSETDNWSGLCRRHAPQSSHDSRWRGHWPITARSEWCGEFQRVEVKEPYHPLYDDPDPRQ